MILTEGLEKNKIVKYFDKLIEVPPDHKFIATDLDGGIYTWFRKPTVSEKTNEWVVDTPNWGNSMWEKVGKWGFSKYDKTKTVANYQDTLRVIIDIIYDPEHLVIILADGVVDNTTVPKSILKQYLVDLAKQGHKILNVINLE